MKKLNNKIQGYLSLISAILINLLNGNLLTFSNLIPYYQSYLYYKHDENEKISAIQLYFLVPIGVFVQQFCPTFMGIIDKKLGIRILTIFTVISLYVSHIIIYFSIEYYLLIISYIFYGFALSCTYYQTVKNCWQFFPEKKDLMTGIIFSSFGLGSFAFTSIADEMINPDNSQKEGKYYSKEIAYNFLTFVKFEMFSIVILGSIACVLCFPYEEEEKNNNENKNKDENKNNENEEKNENKNKDENKNEELIIKKEKSIPLKKMIFSLEFTKCLAIAGCTQIFGYLLTNTYRNFGIEKKLDENGMHILSKVFTLLNTFGRIVWGIICNKFKFKIPYLIIIINQIICGCLIYFSAEKIYTFFIVACFGVLSYSGHIVLFPSLIHSKFGVENSVILLGICGIFVGIAALIGPLLTFFVKELEDYLITYLVGVAPSIVSLLLTIFIKTERISYIDEEIKITIDEIDKRESNKLTDGLFEENNNND